MSVPLLGDISLEYVQQIEHWQDSGFTGTRIAGLAGELQQRSGRASHRVRIAGILFGEGVADALKKLQDATNAGEELTFAADITSALELQKVVIASLHVMELAGQPGRFSYDLTLAESPPLPPPAEVEGFGGLDDFGLGDLGFDTDLMGELGDLAGDVAGAVTDALDVIDQLGALANLGDLQLGNFMEPIAHTVDEMGEIATNFKNALNSLSGLFS